MSLAVLGLVCAYMILGLIFINMLFQNHWRLWAKIVATLTLGTFYYISYVSMLGLQGWPTTSPLPKVTMVLGSYIVEPDKESGKDGYIYVWADDLSSGHPAGKPRAYEIPYDASLHERFLKARKKSGTGIFQILSVSEARTGNVIADFVAGLLTNRKSQKLEITDLPDPALPGK